MAITTMAGVRSGLVPSIYPAKLLPSNGTSGGGYVSPWYEAGFPRASTLNASGMAGQALTSNTNNGAIQYNNPVSGNTYLAKTVLSAGTMQGLLLVDRLWENSGFSVTTTTPQTINSVAWPARDTNQSTNGEGVYIAMEVQTTVGAAVPNLSMSYTNSAGTAGRTGLGVATFVSGSNRGRFWVFGLDAGDTGVRSVQTVTIDTSLVSGTVVLVAFRPIVLLSPEGASLITTGGSNIFTFSGDAFTLGMPQIFDNSVLMFLTTGSIFANYALSGTIDLAQG